MKIDETYNFIWDLDGTLIDSYKVIVDSLYEVSNKHGIDYQKNEINKIIIDNTADTYLNIMHDISGIDMDILIDEHQKINHERRDEIELIENAYGTLKALDDLGAHNYIFTHRSSTAFYFLDRLKITKFFIEIVTSENGFPRKPKGDGVKYLVDKYGLDKKRTFYVGDRTIDMDCAKDAGVGAILFKPTGSFCEENGSEDIIIGNLSEILLF